MSLPKTVYKLLEEIVGPENISDRDYILAAYRHTSPQAMRKPASPDAVIMPGSTEEVQAVMKVCYRNGIRVTAVVSAIGMGVVTGPGMVILSMVRMNKILEINDEDRYAVIEPGVRHVQLKPELMKRGLSYAVPSVGPSCSVLANFLGKGEHHLQYSLSKNNRYLLASEWVSQTGEIIRFGSLADGAGWFCPDGPGLDMGGLIQKGQGVFTKAAIALEEWKGPSQMPCEGRTPNYKVRLPVDLHKVFIFKFKDLDKVRDFMIEMGKAEIGAGLLKFFYATAAVMFTVSANDFWELWQRGLFQKELPLAVWVYLANRTPEEMKYEERVMWQIVDEMDGEEVDESIRKIWEDNMDFFIIVSFLQRVLKLGGGWSPLIHTESIPQTVEIAKAFPEFLNGLIAEGKILNAPYNYQIIPMEYGHAAHIELLYFYDRTVPGRRTVPMEISQKSLENDILHGFHTAPPMFGPPEKFGPLFSDYHIWAAKIKEAFESDGLHRGGG